MTEWGKWTLVITFFLIGIPTAVDFYPQLFAGFLEWIPFDFISPWMFRIGLISLGIAIGWYARDRREREHTEQFDRITGCIEKDGVTWRGVATITQGDIEGVEIPYEAFCPHCKTEMNSENTRTTNIRDSSKHQSLWRCPNSSCGYVTEWSTSDDAENIFKTHIRRIVQSENEEYSLDSLIEQIDGKITGENIWRQYVSNTDDENISISCFH